MISRSELAKLRRYARKQGISSLAVFGSRATGTDTVNSDLDLLVTFKKRKMGLIELIGIQYELEDLMHMPVDLIERSALSPYLRERVLREMITVV